MSFEPLILEEIDQFLKELNKHAGKTYNIKQLLMKSASNNICIMVTGRIFNYNDPQMVKFQTAMKLGEIGLPLFSSAALFPWLSKLPGTNKIFNRQPIRNYSESTIDVTSTIARNVVNEYEDGLQGNYIHAYLTERNSRLKVEENEDIFTETGLYHITRDLLIAGTDTTASTLLFSFFYMTLYPEIQKKVQNEIDSVIGRERQPSYNDRFNMPYTEATILEVHRIVSFVPLSVPHRNVKELTIRGYAIPKNSIIIPNLWAVHHDPNYWGDPETFRPERFIGPDGKFNSSERVIAFSMGKRACVGEPLAAMEMFLYFVSVLKHFTLIPPDGKMPSLATYPGIAARPKFLNICAVAR
ncbi:Cytochrome P450 2 sub R member 1, variant 2 [Chamberlinius hualienensis]